MVTNKDCKYYPFCKFQAEQYYGLNGIRIPRACENCEHFKSIHPEPPYLKPCPFCGGEAERKEGTSCEGHGDFCNYKIVRCKECGAQITGGYYGAKDDTEEKWNRRVRL